MMQISRVLAAAAVASTALLTHVRTADAACHMWQCGGNTPILWGTFIRGLSSQGESNLEGVVLHPELIASPGGRCGGTGVRVVVDDGVLRAVGRDGAPVCTGSELIGAAFDLDVPYKQHKIRVRVQVAAMDQVSTWEREKAMVLPTYRFEVIAQGAWVAPGGEPPRGLAAFAPVTPMPLCETSDTWMEDWQTEGLLAVQPSPAAGIIEYHNPEGTVGQRWQGGTDHAILVNGQSYDEHGSSAMIGQQWFQIACAGSAIAKMRLLGVDPKQPELIEKGVTVSTLKMLGARYGGTTAFTRKGTPIRWERWDARAFYGGPDPRLALGPLEAAWRGDGAVCVSHLRLARVSLGWPVMFEAFVQMAMARVYGTRPCGTTDGAIWVTTTVEHVMH
jgi:hypothetical protein